jgi:predicted ATP-dependent endonuclease of OLD family
MEAMANVKYEHFRIVKYKAISSPVTISLKHNLIPIIGVNECGKTTILKGIFAFDFRNDELITDKSHITSASNLYKVNDPEPCIIEAEILFDKEFFKNELEAFQEDRNKLEAVAFSLKFTDFIEEWGLESIVIQRVLNGKLIYQIDAEIFTEEDKDCVDAFCKHIIKHLPQMMFFDDFNDKIPEKIEVSLSNPYYSGWSGIFLRLLASATEGMSVRDLFNLEEEKIDSALSDVKRRLEETISKEWTGMKLSDEKGKALGFKIDRKYDQAAQTAHFTIKVVETVEGAERVFLLHSRSKGFYWFFNFVMKLMFSPDRSIQDNNRVIFLLDEPGSYLHVSAQKELCKKLATLENATIIYCTHSHNLLHPEHVKLPSIKICGKEANGNIRLFTP